MPDAHHQKKLIKTCYFSSYWENLKFYYGFFTKLLPTFQGCRYVFSQRYFLIWDKKKTSLKFSVVLPRRIKRTGIVL